MAADANRDLPATLENLHTMQADFVQVVGNKSNQKQQSVGSIVLQRPGKFRWEVRDPSPQLIIANDLNILTYDSDLKQLSRQKIDHEQTNNPVVLLSGSIAKLQKDFIIKRVQNASIGDCFELRPKAHDSMFQKIRLQFVQKKLTSMHIVDNLGQQTDINFSNIKINLPVDRKVFVFVPPKGVDVI